MNASIFRGRATSRQRLLALSSLLSLVVSGCGGGGSSNGDSGNYLDFSGSSNGDIVLDASSVYYEVDASSRTVVLASTGADLTGLTVNGNGSVLQNGIVIGSVVLVPSGTTTVALFECSNNVPMGITLSNGSYSTSCAANNGSSGSNGGTSTGSVYGSIAYFTNSAGQFAGLSYDYGSQTAADQEAIQLCDAKSSSQACGVVLNFVGKGSCAALAWSSDGAYGGTTATSLAVAQSEALSSCSTHGGTSCTVGISGCN